MARRRRLTCNQCGREYPQPDVSWGPNVVDTIWRANAILHKHGHSDHIMSHFPNHNASSWCGRQCVETFAQQLRDKTAELINA